jgi:outer membrane biosynthesis protein TonB
MVLRLLATAEQLRQAAPAREAIPARPLLQHDPSPTQIIELPRQSTGRRLAVIAACVIVASAGAASFFVMRRSAPVAPAPAGHALTNANASAAAEKAPPETIVFGDDTPYVVTVRSQADQAKDEAPVLEEQVQADAAPVPERTFVPPPAEPLRAAKDDVVLAAPNLPLQSSTIAAAQPLPVPVAGAPVVPAFKPKPAPTSVVIGGKLEPPQLIHRVQPVFPEAARVSQTEGRVRFRATIAKDGTVKNLRRISGSVILAGACEMAIRQWVYRPAVVDGRPVEAETQIEINFRIAQ